MRPVDGRNASIWWLKLHEEHTPATQIDPSSSPGGFELGDPELVPAAILYFPRDMGTLCRVVWQTDEVRRLNKDPNGLKIHIH